MQNAEHLTFEIFSRSNQDTCLSQKPLVKQGQWVGKGQLLADCINSVYGDLALGKNVLVAYMPWEGYNFEDSIVISDKLISQDVYTSIHILRFRTEILNTNTNPDFRQTGKTLPFKVDKTRTPALVQINAFQKNCIDQKSKSFLFSSQAVNDTLPLYPSFSLYRKDAYKVPFPIPKGKKGCLLSFPRLFSKGTRSFLTLCKARGRSPLCFARQDGNPLLRTTGQQPSSSVREGKEQQARTEGGIESEGKGVTKQRIQAPKVKWKGQVTSTPESSFAGKGERTELWCRSKTTPLRGKCYPFLKRSKSTRTGTVRNSKKYINNNSLSLEKRTRDVPFLGSNLLSHLDNNGIAKVGTWVSPGDVLVGKVRPLANKFKSNRASTQLAWEIVSSRKNELMTMEDRSFRLPKGVSGRVIRTEILKHSSSEHIHVYLAIKRKIQIGDKLAGRHGNKGIVSLVLPKQDMPYLADGTPIDIILSPLGVPSRMNVGQIYECLLGLAARSLICDFKVDNTMQTLSPVMLNNLPFIAPGIPLRTEGEGYEVSVLHSDKAATSYFLQSKSGEKGKRVAFSKGLLRTQAGVAILSQRERTHKNKLRRDGYKVSQTLSEMQFISQKKRTLQGQLKFSSTLEARNLVFLKLYHSRITRQSKWLFSLTHPGKMRLFDGRTGQPFANWITVGYAYMLKLIHLVDNKMHSRSTGPYSLITRQPVTGKARHGGQRIGEMEAWALEGFGAAYTLQEFFSFKGDDVSSRNQWQVTSISQLVGNTTAFKTLFSELRALCISLDFTGYTNS